MTFHTQNKNCNKIKRDIGRQILNGLNSNIKGHKAKSNLKSNPSDHLLKKVLKKSASDNLRDIFIQWL